MNFDWRKRTIYRFAAYLGAINKSMVYCWLLYIAVSRTAVAVIECTVSHQSESHFHVKYRWEIKDRSRSARLAFLDVKDHAWPFKRAVRLVLFYIIIFQRMDEKKIHTKKNTTWILFNWLDIKRGLTWRNVLPVYSHQEQFLQMGPVTGFDIGYGITPPRAKPQVRPLSCITFECY